MTEATKHEALLEDGIVAGNFENKYETTNPIARALVAGFLGAADAFVERTAAREIHEVGCGEGYLLGRWVREGRTLRGSDFSPQVIARARAHAAALDRDIRFEVAGVHGLSPDTHAAELVVCCEVLEHVEDPEAALAVLATLARPWLLVSVPREPVWRAMNMARGRYWGDLGNTPGHINHWSRRGFLSMLRRHGTVVDVATPLPWTMALCRVDAGR